jgi:cation diffusion facilitator CzcD-associated flavoprotein CzcO
VAEWWFGFWVANFQDLLFDLKANRTAYDFWAQKTRARITDPKKRDLLAPLEPPHPFGTKRPSLEQNFYEICNQENVHIVNTSAAPIEDITESGIRTADGWHYEVDVIAIATGFDSINGGMKSMGLRDVNGVDLADRWADGTTTYLGLTIRDYPNMFFTYTVHGPTAFCNGPSCVETQSDIIVDTIRRLEREGKQFINPKPEAEEGWSKEIQTVNTKSLFPLAKSWYMGANIPGKKTEQLSYLKGLPVYEQECRKALENFTGFVVA